MGYPQKGDNLDEVEGRWKLADEEQIKILKKGVAVWNEWRAKYFNVKIDLSQSDLKGTALIGANLSAADLRGANLSETDLRGAILSGAKLAGSNFLKAVVGNTIFGNSDLSEAIGLENVIHCAPSQIAADTFVLSKGKIPETFLQGCGLSNADTEYTELSNPRLSHDMINRRFMNKPGSSGFATSYFVDHVPRR